MVYPDAQNRVELNSLQQRAEELDCYYRIHELLRCPDKKIEEVCREFLNALIPGLLPADEFSATVSLKCKSFGFDQSNAPKQVYTVELLPRQPAAGRLLIYYTGTRLESRWMPLSDNKLKFIKTIAKRLGSYFVNLQVDRLIEQHGSGCITFPDNLETEKSYSSCCRCIDNHMFHIAFQKMLLAIHLATTNPDRAVCPFMRISLPDEAVYDSEMPEPTGGTVWCELLEEDSDMDKQLRSTVRALIVSNRIQSSQPCVIRDIKHTTPPDRISQF